LDNTTQNDIKEKFVNEGEVKPKFRTPAAPCKLLKPDDINKRFVNEDKVEWMFCTKSPDFFTGKRAPGLAFTQMQNTKVRHR
jgi:hypothetical protein